MPNYWFEKIRATQREGNSEKHMWHFGIESGLTVVNEAEVRASTECRIYE